MSSSPESARLLAAGCLAAALAAGAAHAAPPARAGVAAALPAYDGIGRAATPAELSAWDIDVRPDFRGLPKGSGSVEKGQEVWEAKCASCHGVFGESREVFNPIVGGTTKDDVATGRAARLKDPAYPERTAMMKLSTLSTLWDFVRRAMPWNAPKSLTNDEVYAVVAYVLNLAYVVPDDFVLSDANIADVQKKLPNRNGMTTNHGMWPGRELGNGGKRDVQGSSCMTNCATEPKVASLLPDFARNSHGNLALQVRTVGVHGADTAGGAPAAGAPPAAAPAGAVALLQKNGCIACHAIDSKLVGPAYRDVAKKHAGRGDLVEYLSSKIRGGGTGVWGEIPMPPQTLSADDAKAIAQWLADGAKQ